MDAADKTHGIVVLFHFLHLFWRKGQKLKKHCRLSHLVPPSHDLYEFLKLFPPLLVISLIFLCNLNQLRDLNESLYYRQQWIKFGYCIRKPLKVFF